MEYEKILTFDEILRLRDLESNVREEMLWVVVNMYDGGNEAMMV